MSFNVSIFVSILNKSSNLNKLTLLDICIRLSNTNINLFNIVIYESNVFNDLVI